MQRQSVCIFILFHFADAIVLCLDGSEESFADTIDMQSFVEMIEMILLKKLIKLYLINSRISNIWCQQGYIDNTTGAYGVANDVFFYGDQVSKFFKEWYSYDLFKLNMYVHFGWVLIIMISQILVE